ncbi:aldo/keto reductase [Corynebacterium halotolerans YIM 70093 = DSM 44683]|uniref:Aldo/keto reductase n=1 Tax=Corynebacterium halotolerans YIM 70093 = DSM 44683 TaxID=1121362 RepID=M1P9I5_9CORY|nr:aldo/keto reductase [Corynebacterium halotolerans YIM 70093 = DSM 44683]
MDMRVLGRQGLTVSALNYGAMGTVVNYGPSDDTWSIAAIRRAHARGVTMFDTAEMYGWGEGERLLGHAVTPFRDEVVLATKFGLTPGSGPNSRPRHISKAVDNSLLNLGVGSIDLLYQRLPDPDVPVEEVVG